MTQTISCSARSSFAALAAFAIALSTANSGVSAQETKAKPLPPGVTACNFDALANDHTREGLNMRAEPRTGSAILDRLPILENPYHEKVAADFHVIGVMKGWFLIENASYADNDFPNRPTVYSGRGWVSGKLLTTQIRMWNLRAEPDDNAADVGEMGDDFGITAILDCKGEWLRVEAPQKIEGDTPTSKRSSDRSKAIMRGWTHGVCANQRTTCGG